MFANLGAAFGISDELAAQAVRYFLPPIVKGIARQTESSRGLLQFLEFVGSMRFDLFLDDPAIFGQQHIEDHGRAILNSLFQKPEHLRKIVSNRAKVLPISPRVLEAMFPYIAVLALGGIEQKTRQPLVTILQGLAFEKLDTDRLSNPYAALAREIRGRRIAARKRPGAKRSAGLSGVIGSLFAKSDARTAAA